MTRVQKFFHQLLQKRKQRAHKINPPHIEKQKKKDQQEDHRDPQSFFKQEREVFPQSLPKGNSFLNFISSKMPHIEPAFIIAVCIVCIGGSAILFGLWQFFEYSNQTRVEIIAAERHEGEVWSADEENLDSEAISIQQTSSTQQENFIFIDVAGAVLKPGLYQLADDKRVGDAVEIAGGFSAQADPDAVAKQLNLAQKLTDGMKVYVPFLGENETVSESSGITSSSNSSLININTATKSELDELKGIGEKRAEDIITNRPYSAVSELKTKAKIPSNVYDDIKDEVGI